MATDANTAVQKQAIQQQLAEIDLALKELEHSESAYRIVNQLLIKTDVAVLRSDLAAKKESLHARLQSLERHTAPKADGRDH